MEAKDEELNTNVCPKCGMSELMSARWVWNEGRRYIECTVRSCPNCLIQVSFNTERVLKIVNK